MKLYRAGDAKMDRTLSLKLDTSAASGGGAGGRVVWRASSDTPLAKGHWRLRVELDSQPPLAFEVDRDVQ